MGLVSTQTTEAMATATTKTTTAVASTTAVIAARKHPRKSLLIRNTAKYANAWTLRPSLVATAKGVVVRRATKAMETVTITTTTVVVITTAVIAARKHSRRQLTKNTAKSASAWIRTAN